MRFCALFCLGSGRRVVQPGERLFYTQEVGGSSPSSPTNFFNEFSNEKRVCDGFAYVDVCADC